MSRALLHVCYCLSINVLFSYLYLHFSHAMYCGSADSNRKREWERERTSKRETGRGRVRCVRWDSARETETTTHDNGVIHWAFVVKMLNSLIFERWICLYIRIKQHALTHMHTHIHMVYSFIQRVLIFACIFWGLSAKTKLTMQVTRRMQMGRNWGVSLSALF